MEDKKNKFNPVLQERIDQDKKISREEAELRKKYGIEDGRTVGIKINKESFITVFWKIISSIIRNIFNILLIGLALLGATALIHPDAREVMLIIWKNSLEQIKTFAPFLPI